MPDLGPVPHLGFALVIIAVALFFDFTNGFHDAANAIATSISTHALSPRVALALAAVLNLVGAFVSTKVAATVGKGLIDAHSATLTVVLAALTGAISWNLVTWWWGLPSSSSHSLVGGLIGAATAHAGTRVVLWSGVWTKVALPGLVSPLAGGALGLVLMVALSWIFRALTPSQANRGFRSAQTLSAAFVAFNHGSNDAQKTMGIITLTLISDGTLASKGFHVPIWVIVASASAIALGTYSGGWRVIRTMGTRIIRLGPPQGFAAEASSGVVIYVATQLGLPVSTTHTISGAIMGVGSTRRLSAVRWGVAGNILAAWIVTIPAAAVVGALSYMALHLIGF